MYNSKIMNIKLMLIYCILSTTLKANFNLKYKSVHRFLNNNTSRRQKIRLEYMQLPYYSTKICTLPKIV